MQARPFSSAARNGAATYRNWRAAHTHSSGVKAGFRYRPQVFDRQSENAMILA
jgi:hypothetical protein